MSLIGDIASAYRGPRAEMRHQLSLMTEPRTMMLGLTACFLSFVSELPGIAAAVTIADESGSVFNGKMGALFIWRVFFGLLLLYALAAISHLVLRTFGGQGTWEASRLAIMWAVLVATPLVLISGILKVFGPPPVFLVASLLTTVVFFWQWATCLAVVEFPRQSEA